MSNAIKNAFTKAGFYPKKKNKHFLERVKQTPNPANDGVTHINVDVEGKTDLGISLAMGKLAFNHPILGSFICLTAYSLMINSNAPNERFRFMTYNEAKALQLRAKSGHTCKGYVSMMKEGYRCILQDHPKLLEEFKTSTLPLDAYFVSKETGLPVRSRKASWLIDILEELREEFKTGKISDFKPDYSHILQIMESKMEPVVEPVVEETLSSEETDKVKDVKEWLEAVEAVVADDPEHNEVDSINTTKINNDTTNTNDSN